MVSKIRALLALTRLDKPRGIVLLAWPTLMPFALHPDQGSLVILFIYILGVIIARSIGCVVNDWWDQGFDGHVERTKSRPLAVGVLSNKEVLWVLIVLGMVGLIALFQLDLTAILIGAVAGIMMCVYPLMKRWVVLPQVFLGLTFATGIWMAMSSLSQPLDIACLNLYLFWVVWIFLFDTLYAKADMVDDELLGLNSSAIYFGEKLVPIMHFAYILLLIWMWVNAWIYGLGQIYSVGLL